MEGDHMTLYSRNTADRYIALGFFLLELVVLIRNWLTGYWVFYWFCDFAPLCLALCFAFQKHQAAKGLMYIGLLGQGAYTLSFFSTLLFNVPFLGFAIPVTQYPLESLASLVIHLSTFAAVVGTAHTRPTKQALMYSGVFLLGIYTIVRIFTTPETAIDYNFNYIYSFDALSAFPTIAPFYTTLWVPIVFIIIVLPTFWIDRMVFALRHHLPQTPIRLTRQHA